MRSQVCRLFGYAGSGKSTVLKFALDELGLEPHRGERDGGDCVPGVVTATFTGKAALVLRRKGTPARTIHSLIYSVIEATEEEIAAAQKKIEQAENEARRLSGFDRTSADAAIEAMRQSVAGMKKPRFALNPQSDAAHAKLIVLDEVSMVGEEMARDLMSFGKPILVLGDPGELPPIKGEGAFTKDAPDIMLTEIHRQAAESAIIRLATMARQGQPIGFGQHDTFVWKMRKADVTPEQCLRGGQVICGMNATRLQLNNGMRRAAGLGDGGYRAGQGRRLACTNDASASANKNVKPQTLIPYDILCGIVGKPSNSEMVLLFVAPRAFRIPANAAGSYLKAGIAATGSSVFSVQKNGTQFLTATVAGSATATFSSSQTDFAAGDVLKVVAPATADATLADIAITLAATLL